MTTGAGRATPKGARVISAMVIAEKTEKKKQTTTTTGAVSKVVILGAWPTAGEVATTGVVT